MDKGSQLNRHLVQGRVSGRGKCSVFDKAFKCEFSVEKRNKKE